MPEGIEGVVDQNQGGAASGANGATGSTGSAASGASGSGTPPPSPKWEEDPKTVGMRTDLQKERKARQQFETEINTIKAQLEEKSRQIAALTGAKPPTDAELEAAAIRSKFGEVFSREQLLELVGLTEEDIEGIKEARQTASAAQEAVERHWTEHGRRMLDQVYAGISAETGELTARQKRRIAQLYVGEAESSPEFLKRHDAGDKSVIEEFVKGYLEDTVEPVRRKVTATEASRFRALPNGGNRALPQREGKPIDVTNDKDVMDFIMEGRKGKFAR